MLSFPCETAVWKTLPSIRSALARALIARGLTQRQIAKILATTEATISHYRKGKRGGAITLGPKVLTAIEKLADQVSVEAIGTQELREQICRLCNQVHVPDMT